MSFTVWQRIRGKTNAGRKLLRKTDPCCCGWGRKRTAIHRGDKAMSLLWLSHFVPYPPKGGSYQRSYNLLKETARKNDVYLIALKHKTSTHPQAEIELAKKELGVFCKEVHIIDISSRISGASMYMLSLKSLLQGIPLSVSMYQFPEMSCCIKEVSERVQFDVVHFDTISLAIHRKDVGSAATVMNHHNVESFMMTRRVANEPNLLKRLFFRLEGWRLRKYEKEYCAKFRLNLAVSEPDSEMFREIAPDARFEVVSNGVDTRYFLPENDYKKKSRLIFAGRLDQYSNKDAILHFCTKAWPLVKEANPEITLTIIGSGVASQQLTEIARNDNRIELLGYVDDVRPYFAESLAMVCPIRDGGGTRLKILDAMAMGMPIVSTTIACEGIDVAKEEELLIADTPEEFNEQIHRVYTDDALRASLGVKARAKAEMLYSWDIIGKKLNRLYAELKVSAS